MGYSYSNLIVVKGSMVFGASSHDNDDEKGILTLCAQYQLTQTAHVCPVLIIFPIQ